MKYGSFQKDTQQHDSLRNSKKLFGRKKKSDQQDAFHNSARGNLSKDCSLTSNDNYEFQPLIRKRRQIAGNGNNDVEASDYQQNRNSGNNPLSKRKDDLSEIRQELAQRQFNNNSATKASENFNHSKKSFANVNSEQFTERESRTTSDILEEVAQRRDKIVKTSFDEIEQEQNYVLNNYSYSHSTNSVLVFLSAILSVIPRFIILIIASTIIYAIYLINYDSRQGNSTSQNAYREIYRRDTTIPDVGDIMRNGGNNRMPYGRSYDQPRTKYSSPQNDRSYPRDDFNKEADRIEKEFNSYFE